MNKNKRRKNRHFRIRKKVAGTKELPRLSVFRSNKNIYAQLIDDESAKTIASASSLKILKPNDKKKSRLSKAQLASLVGETLAGRALRKNIKKVVFDRSGYKYHGKVKSLAVGARKGGLKF